MVKRKKKVNENAWFCRGESSWNVVPVNWKGWAFFVFFIGLNVFAFSYFNLNELVLDNYLKMGAVLFLSLFIFSEVVKKKSVEGKK